LDTPRGWAPPAAAPSVDFLLTVCYPRVGVSKRSPFLALAGAWSSDCALTSLPPCLACDQRRRRPREKVRTRTLKEAGCRRSSRWMRCCGRDGGAGLWSGGLPRSLCRRRRQTIPSCCGQEPWWCERRHKKSRRERGRCGSRKRAEANRYGRLMHGRLVRQPKTGVPVSALRKGGVTRRAVVFVAWCASDRPGPDPLSCWNAPLCAAVRAFALPG
jgi:hypothetical protein